MITEAERRSAAAALMQADRDRRPITQLSLTYPDLEIEDAYAIQQLWAAERVAAGATLVGHKIGLTSRAMQMASSSDAIVGNAPVKDGGIAGGLQATSLQVGGALGTSVLVSLISSRVGSTLTDSLTDAGVPHSAAARFEEAKDAVAMGVAPVSDAMPAQLRAAVMEGSHTAFMNGVHTADLVTGVLALVGAALAAFGLRGREDGNHETNEHDTKVPATAAVRSSTDGPVSGHTDLDGGEYTITAAGYPRKATHLTVRGSGVESHDIEISHPGE